MKIPVVTNFFGCIELRTGALILGWISALSYGLSAFIALMFLIFGLEVLKAAVIKSKSSESFHEKSLEFGPVPAIDPVPTSPPVESIFEQAFVVIMIIVIVILCVLCLVSVMFIKGISEGNVGKTKPFMWINAISTTLAVINFVLTIPIVDLIFCCLSVYFCLVIYSMHLVLSGEDIYKTSNDYSAQYSAQTRPPQYPNQLHPGMNQTYDQNAYGMMEEEKNIYQASGYQGP